MLQEHSSSQTGKARQEEVEIVEVPHVSHSMMER
jgi:hypothetical protein